MDMLLGKCKFQKCLVSVNFKNVVLIFSNIGCWYTLELPLRGNSNVDLQHMPWCTLKLK